MNLVDVTIIKILEKPKQVVTEDHYGSPSYPYKLWVVKVLTDCYGHKQEKVFTGFSKEEISKYKKGYSWME